ncbi:thioredoxin domain-containing protein [Geodermatophilus obscurus]|uniref:thioredoxin family protein n=1 Tax=Geodermatophilus obscurus TaxID=1861 RepID=UPI0009F6E431
MSSRVPVLVDVTAAWCPPRRMVEPVLREIAADGSHRLRVLTLDVDRDPLDRAGPGAPPRASLRAPSPRDPSPA